MSNRRLPVVKNNKNISIHQPKKWPPSLSRGGRLRESSSSIHSDLTEKIVVFWKVAASHMWSHMEARLSVKKKKKQRASERKKGRTNEGGMRRFPFHSVNCFNRPTPNTNWWIWSPSVAQVLVVMNELNQNQNEIRLSRLHKPQQLRQPRISRCFV